VSDWKVGSTLLFRGVWEGKAYEDKGFILELEKEKKIKIQLLEFFFWKQRDVPENYAHVIMKLRSKATKLFSN